MLKVVLGSREAMAEQILRPRVELDGGVQIVVSRGFQDEILAGATRF